MREQDDKAIRELAGKVALVTGGSKGLGLLIAHELGLAGAKVNIVARDVVELQDACDWLARRGVAASYERCDVGNRHDVQQAISAIEASSGPIDVLVNNAGIIQVGPLESTELSDFEDAMRTMFWGAVYPTWEVLPGMRQRGWGRIATITSIGGKVSMPHMLPYSTAKFAAVGFSEGLHAELAGTGVSAITVVPGFMRTGSHLNAVFKGEPRREYGLFTFAASMPGVTIPAEGAARRIVRAIANKEAEVTLSVPANVLQRFYGFLPGTSSRLLSLVHRLLPGSGSNEARKGAELAPSYENHGAFQAATKLGRNAAHDYQPALANRHAAGTQA